MIYKAQEGRFGRWETRREGPRGREGSQEEDEEVPPMKEAAEEEGDEAAATAAQDKSDVQQEVYGYSNEWREPTASYR